MSHDRELDGRRCCCCCRHHGSGVRFIFPKQQDQDVADRKRLPHIQQRARVGHQRQGGTMFLRQDRREVRAQGMCETSVRLNDVVFPFTTIFSSYPGPGRLQQGSQRDRPALEGQRLRQHRQHNRRVRKRVHGQKVSAGRHGMVGVV